jgi:hypothetical protein
MLVRRDLLFQVGLFDPALPPVEDRDCWLRLLSVSTMAVVERSLMRSRLHEFNLSHDYFRWNAAATLLTERILTNPAKYPPAVIERYRKEGARWPLNAGRLADHAGKPRQARHYYLQAWRWGGGLRPLALAALSYLPAPVRFGVRGAARAGRRFQERLGGAASVPRG